MNVTKKLEAIQCRFLWGGMEGYKKYHLVVWSGVKKPLALGGLGLRSLAEMNETL